MQFWEDIGKVDMKHVKASQNLHEFHTRLTARILGYPSAREIFDEFFISDQDIRSLKVKTLMMVSKDDPIVSYSSMPLESLQNNEQISFHATDRGGHLCWFSGLKPKRWYPKPVLQYLKNLRLSEGL
jgi:predicted alpha/beta-fold hydrolase